MGSESVERPGGIEPEREPLPGTADDVGQENLAVAQLLTRARYAATPGFELRLRHHLYAQMDRPRNRGLAFGRLVRAASMAGLAIVVFFGLVLVSVPGVAAQANQLVVRFIATASGLLPLQVSGRAPAPPSLPVPAPATETLGTQPKMTLVPQGNPSNLVVPAPWTKTNQSPVPLQLPTLPSTLSFASLTTAQTKVDFKIHVPSWLPDGYTLKGAAVPPDLPQAGVPAGSVPQATPGGLLPAVTLVFSDAAGDMLILNEMHIPNAQVSGPVELPSVNASVQKVSVNGQPGQLMEANGFRQLHWQGSDGILYDLSSRSTKQVDLLRMAESVR